jgi:hypothetical protein
MDLQCHLSCLLFALIWNAIDNIMVTFHIIIKHNELFWLVFNRHK